MALFYETFTIYSNNGQTALTEPAARLSALYISGKYIYSLLSSGSPYYHYTHNGTKVMLGLSLTPNATTPDFVDCVPFSKLAFAEVNVPLYIVEGPALGNNVLIREGYLTRIANEIRTLKSNSDRFDVADMGTALASASHSCGEWTVPANYSGGTAKICALTAYPRAFFLLGEYSERAYRIQESAMFVVRDALFTGDDVPNTARVFKYTSAYGETPPTGGDRSTSTNFPTHSDRYLFMSYFDNLDVYIGTAGNYRLYAGDKYKWWAIY